MTVDSRDLEEPSATDHRPISWDDCPVDALSRGHLRAGFTDLGAAGSLATGPKRIVVEPGAQSSPAHVHGAEEEIFFVLGGSGLSWQDGATYEVGPGDCLVHLPGGSADAIVHLAGGEAHALVARGERLDVLARPAGTGRPHAFRAGRSGLVPLAFGERKAEDYVYCPRSGIIFFRGVDLAARLEVADLWAVEEDLVTRSIGGRSVGLGDDRGREAACSGIPRS